MMHPQKQPINRITSYKNHKTMRKLILTLAIILGISLTTFAEGGLFNRGNNSSYGQTSGYSYYDTKGGFREDVVTPMLPLHNQTTNHPASETTPLGSGIAVLLGLGAAYAVAKKRNEK